MSKQREALELALNTLRGWIGIDEWIWPVTAKESCKKNSLEAIEAIRKALAEPEPEQEPVAWGAFYFGGKRNGKLYSYADNKDQIETYILDRHRSDDSNTFRAAPLYTAPPARKPLTDDETMHLANQTAGTHWGTEAHLQAFRRAIERAHGIGGEG
jgi:hypothetical protein